MNVSTSKSFQSGSGGGDDEMSGGYGARNGATRGDEGGPHPLHFLDVEVADGGGEVEVTLLDTLHVDGSTARTGFQGRVTHRHSHMKSVVRVREGGDLGYCDGHAVGGHGERGRGKTW